MVGDLLPCITQIMDGLSDLVAGADGAGDGIRFPPTLTFTFSEDISSVGFTLIFDSTHGQWPTRFHIAVYNSGNALIAETDVENDGYQSIVPLPMLFMLCSSFTVWMGEAFPYQTEKKVAQFVRNTLYHQHETT